jgi:hypothetical protein
MPALEAKRGTGQRGRHPLSAATRKRVLAGLMQRAEGGDAAAAEALVRLSLSAEATAAKDSRRRDNAAEPIPPRGE